MSNLFTLAYWFNSRPAPLGHYPKIVMGLFIILLAALFTFLKIMKDRGYNSKMWLSLADFAFTNVLLALVIMFFSLELVPFLAAKFWLILWLAEMIAWLTIIFKRVKRLKIKKTEADREEINKKYIPQ